MSVWDKLTPNHKDLALSMTLMPRGQLDPLLAEMQGLELLQPLLCKPMQSCTHKLMRDQTEPGVVESRLPLTLLAAAETLTTAGLLAFVCMGTISNVQCGLVTGCVLHCM